MRRPGEQRTISRPQLQFIIFAAGPFTLTAGRRGRCPVMIRPPVTVIQVALTVIAVRPSFRPRVIVVSCLTSRLGAMPLAVRPRAGQR